MQRVTVPAVLYELTRSASWVGFAGFVQFLPVVILSPVGGWLADRFPRRYVLFVSQAATALVATALWWGWVTGRAGPGFIVVSMALTGAAFGLSGPAWQAFVSDLVPPESLFSAVALNSAQFNASRAAGPALAGVVMGWWGPGWAFALNAISFAAVLAALLMVGVDARGGGASRPLGGFVEALRWTRRNRGVVATLVVVAALGLTGGPLIQLLVVFARDVFEVGDEAYGLLGASMGIGAVAVAPWLARTRAVSRSRLVLWGTVAHAASLVGLATTTDFAAGVAALLVAGASWLTLASALNTTIQVQVTDDVRGRVLALYLMVLTLAMPLGSLIQGAAVDAFGPRVPVATAGVLFAAVGIASNSTGLLASMDSGSAAAADGAHVSSRSS